MMSQMLASIISLMAEAPIIEGQGGAGELEMAMNIRKYGFIALIVIVVVLLIYWFTKKK